LRFSARMPVHRASVESAGALSPEGDSLVPHLGLAAQNPALELQAGEAPPD